MLKSLFTVVKQFSNNEFFRLYTEDLRCIYRDMLYTLMLFGMYILPFPKEILIHVLWIKCLIPGNNEFWFST